MTHVGVGDVHPVDDGAVLGLALVDLGRVVRDDVDRVRQAVSVHRDRLFDTCRLPVPQVGLGPCTYGEPYGVGTGVLCEGPDLGLGLVVRVVSPVVHDRSIRAAQIGRADHRGGVVQPERDRVDPRALVPEGHLDVGTAGGEALALTGQRQLVDGRRFFVARFVRIRALGWELGLDGVGHHLLRGTIGELRAGVSRRRCRVGSRLLVELAT